MEIRVENVSLIENETWDTVDRSNDISTKWVFSVEEIERKEIVKDRLVARGFEDSHYYGFKSIYSAWFVFWFRWLAKIVSN